MFCAVFLTLRCFSAPLSCLQLLLALRVCVCAQICRRFSPQRRTSAERERVRAGRVYGGQNAADRSRRAGSNMPPPKKRGQKVGKGIQRAKDREPQTPPKRDAKAMQNGSKKRRAYGTPDSHVVPHRSTDRACSGLTAQFGRDTVRFTEYGRRRVHEQNHSYM